MEELTGFTLCNDHVCRNAFLDLHKETQMNSPGISKMLTPRSNIIITRKWREKIRARILLFPEFSRDHFHLSFINVTILKPSLPVRCHEIDVQISLPNKSPSLIYQTGADLSATITNKGKVSDLLLSSSY